MAASGVAKYGPASSLLALGIDGVGEAAKEAADAAACRWAGADCVANATATPPAAARTRQVVTTAAARQFTATVSEAPAESARQVGARGRKLHPFSRISPIPRTPKDLVGLAEEEQCSDFRIR